MSQKNRQVPFSGGDTKGNKTVRHQDISAPVEKDSSAPLKKSVK
jgi:hypothetical protein